MTYLIAGVLIALGTLGGYRLGLYLVRRQEARRESQEGLTYEDPEVQNMLREVIRTGRPMVMNFGEKPRFIDGKPDNDGQ